MNKNMCFQISGIALAAVALAWLAAGCETVNKITAGAADIAAGTGLMTSDQAESAKRVSGAVTKTFQDITPEQEYYIGRTVAATVLLGYQTKPAADLNAYLNTLGQALAQFSTRPETFGGYHFLALDSDEINAFAAPGGLILVTRGLLKCCQTEDELAAVLAHEIGHVEKLHGLRAIRTGRLNSALTILAVEAGKNLAGEQLAEVTKAFEGSITDISATLMNSGYARSLENDADAAAVQILTRAGYRPHALIDMLTEMKARLASDARGFGKTHPSPEVRIQHVASLIGQQPAVAAPAARQQRFDAMLGKIR